MNTANQSVVRQLKIFPVLACLLVVGGCASVPEHPDVPKLPVEANQSCKKMSGYSVPDAAKAFAKKTGTRCGFHVLAANPEQTVRLLQRSEVWRPQPAASRSDLLLVALEKPRNPNGLNHCIGPDANAKPSRECFWVGHFGVDRGRDSNSIAKARKTLTSELNDGRPSIITHIGLFKGQVNNSFDTPCFIYNVYGQGQRCHHHVSVPENTVTNELPQFTEQALLALRKTLSELITAQQPTHIIVMATGWNTLQFESLYNYRDWIHRFHEAASDAPAKSFRPLFIGVSWESTWTRLPKALSAITKGNDADEIGYSWVNKVLNESILPASETENSPQVILVGHSYGARLLGSALFSRDLLAHRDMLGKKVPDKYIGLQSAFPMRRLTYEGREPTWAHYATVKTPIFLFSSSHDLATSMFFLPTYAGGKHARNFAMQNASWISLEEADATGMSRSTSKKPVTVIDASAFVNQQMPGTDGGAHSDVFDKEMAKAIMGIIFER